MDQLRSKGLHLASIPYLTLEDCYGIDPYVFLAKPPGWSPGDPLPLTYYRSDPRSYRHHARAAFRISHGMVNEESSPLERLVFCHTHSLPYDSNLTLFYNPQGPTAFTPLKSNNLYVFSLLLSKLSRARSLSVRKRALAKANMKRSMKREPRAKTAGKTKAKPFRTKLLEASSDTQLLLLFSDLPSRLSKEELIELAKNKRSNNIDLWTRDVARAFGEALRSFAK